MFYRAFFLGLTQFLCRFDIPVCRNSLCDDRCDQELNQTEECKWCEREFAGYFFDTGACKIVNLTFQVMKQFRVLETRAWTEKCFVQRKGFIDKIPEYIVSAVQILIHLASRSATNIRSCIFRVLNNSTATSRLSNWSTVDNNFGHLQPKKLLVPERDYDRSAVIFTAPLSHSFFYKTTAYSCNR